MNLGTGCRRNWDQGFRKQLANRSAGTAGECTCNRDKGCGTYLEEKTQGQALFKGCVVEERAKEFWATGAGKVAAQTGVKRLWKVGGSGSSTHQ